MKVYGFGLLRNGVKYDYSFHESLTSQLGVADEVYLALGDSEDTTEEEVRKISDKIKIIPTVWDPEIMRQKGIILSVQTNIALEDLRKDKANEEDAWGVYLQSDEILHEDDYELIKEDIRKANEQGCDAMRFRYLHFWHSHHAIAINKKWYPQEIRAVKLNSNAESWGDAQGFRNYTKVYQSEARIFHYGHIRQPEKYAVKKKEFLELYHDDKKIKKYRKREERYDKQTKCLTYLGPHPKVMQTRIEKLGDIFQAEKKDEVYIVGNKPLLKEGFERTIYARKINWVDRVKDVPKDKRKEAVILEPNFFHSLFYKTSVPKKMESKLALPWSPEFYLTLKLAEKGVGVTGR